jgi:hypothetical protein
VKKPGSRGEVVLAVWSESTIGMGGWAQETPASIEAIAAGGNGLQMALDTAGQVWSKSTIGMRDWVRETPASIHAIAAGEIIHLGDVV